MKSSWGLTFVIEIGKKDAEKVEELYVIVTMAIFMIMIHKGLVVE